VGTTDAAEFDVRTNNIVRARFMNTGQILLNAPTVAGNAVVGNTNAATAALTGTNNTVFGVNAAASMTTGLQNTAYGQQALSFNVNGQGNTAIGRVAMANGATGSANTAVGGFSLLNTTAFFNTAIGYASGQTITTGGDNVAVGDFTLTATTTGSGNTAVGSEAGGTITTGSQNTFVGNLTNASANNLTNATAIGALAQVNASNAVVLGSVAGVNTAATTVNVGIGVNAPSARLHTNGAYASTPAAVAAAAAPAIPNNIGHVRITNVVGAQANAVAAPGVATEGQKLTIVNEDDNAATFVGATIPANGGVGNFIYANGVWRLESTSAAAPAGWGLTGNAGTVAGTNFLGTTDAVRFDIRTNNTIRATVDANGNVGIGTVAPNAALQLGNVLSNRRIVLWEDANNDHQVYGLGINAGTLRFQVSSTAGQYTFNAATGPAASNELVRIQGNGLVGIGTAAPAFRLDVANGGVRIQDNGHPGFPNGYQYLTIGDDAYFSDVDVANTTALFGLANPDRAGLYLGSSGALVYGINGFIGINTATPAQSLHVQGTTRVSTLATGSAANRLTQSNTNGDLSMGPRYLHGRINADGTIAGGSGGYTITKLGVGQYRINYTTAFAGVPTVTSVPQGSAGGACANTPPATCGVTWDTWGCSDGDIINNFSTTGGVTNITNNGSGCSGGVAGYGNFTAMVVTVPLGGSFNVSMSAGTWSQGYRIWIDANQNGTFEATESYYNSGGTGTGVFNGTINTTGIPCGTYRMRVRCVFVNVPDVSEGCNNPFGRLYGEAEDYTLVITGAGTGVVISNLNNPTTGDAEVRTFTNGGAAVDAPFHFNVFGQ
jgi:hypothetical protein